jgi:sigma-B regulation protein RsbU (phosphoserine phosphatase)
MMNQMQADAQNATQLGNSLELLADMGRDFAGSGDIDATLVRALERITDYLNAEGGALFLLADDDRLLTCHSCVGETEITGITLKSDHGIVGRCVQTNTGEIVRDVSKDPNFDSSVDEKTGFTTKSILCAPLSVKDEVLGAIELINKKGGDNLFDPADLTLLEVLSNSAALAILNARMAERLVEQEKTRRELELAAEIQRNLLPSAPGPDHPIDGINIPARTVSGDFYDFFSLPDGRIIFCLGDVSGKGMNAALLMAKTASLFRCLGKTINSPGRLLGVINSEICETATRGMFITMIAGYFDPDTDEICFANAGHEPPLYLPGEENAPHQSFAAEAPPIGISPMVVPEEGYPEEKICLDFGSFYVFTDGVTEGEMEDGSMLGVSGVIELLNKGRARSLQSRLHGITQRLDRGDGDLHDDITILGISRAGGADRNDGTPLVSRRLPARAKNLKTIRTVVGEALSEEKIDEKIAAEVVLAIDEACQNIIRHAYGKECDKDISLEVHLRDDRLEVNLTDEAPPIDLEAVKPRNLDEIRPGGLGTHFISEIMDEVTYSHLESGTGNRLHMVKTIS